MSSSILTGDYGKFKDTLNSMIIMDYMLKQRDNTECKPFLLTNIFYEVTRTGVVDLPNYVKSKRCINALISKWSGQKYINNLCAFRCFSLSKNANTINLTESVKYHFNQQIKYDSKDDSFLNFFCLNQFIILILMSYKSSR